VGVKSSGAILNGNVGARMLNILVGDNSMRKLLIALLAAATVLTTAFASSNKAEAWWG
jgi:hypothetical protein